MANRYILTPWFIGQPDPGLEPLAQPGWQLNNPGIANAQSRVQMAILYRRLADMVFDAVAGKQRPVSISGDCLSSLGVLAGLQQAGINPTLIWFDAHGDFNTPQTTPSGFLGGMPLAMLAGRGDQSLVDDLGLAPLPESQIILTDARELDPGEKEAVADSGMTHLPQTESLLDFSLPDGPIYIHFDVDIINPIEAPAMRYATTGGPTTAILRQVFQRLAKTGQVAAVSVSTWDTAQDVGQKSQLAAMKLLAHLVEPGGNRGHNRPA